MLSGWDQTPHPDRFIPRSGKSRSEDHRVDRLAARAYDVGGRDRLAVTRRRRMRGARPEARRDEEQEFPHSGNRQLAGHGRGICHFNSVNNPLKAAKRATN